MSKTAKKAAPEGSGYHCNTCGRPFNVQPWMEPEREYMCWSCARAVLHRDFEEIARQRKARLN